MDRGTHTSTKICRAAVKISVLLTQLKVLAGLSLDRVLNSLDAPGKPLKHSLHVPTLLHGNDSQLILLVHPDQECFLLVVEDSSALGPVSLHTSSNQVLISRDK